MFNNPTFSRCHLDFGITVTILLQFQNYCHSDSIAVFVIFLIVQATMPGCLHAMRDTIDLKLIIIAVTVTNNLSYHTVRRDPQHPLIQYRLQFKSSAVTVTDTLLNHAV